MPLSREPVPPDPSPRHHRGWVVSVTSGPAGAHHQRVPLSTGTDAVAIHEIWIHRVARQAVVFGSTQRLDPRPPPSGGTIPHPDPGRIDTGDVEICHRRSGGGLVHIDPEDVWIDAVLPTDSPLHQADIGRAFAWFGRTWLAALRQTLSDDAPLTIARPTPPAGDGDRSTDRPARPFFCFADIGHGEVLFDGAKVVGISQRRTRSWTRLQSLFIPHWRPQQVDRAVRLALGGVGPGPELGLGGPPYDATAIRAGLPADTAITGDVIEAVLANLPDVSVERPVTGG